MITVIDYNLPRSYSNSASGKKDAAVMLDPLILRFSQSLDYGSEFKNRSLKLVILSLLIPPLKRPFSSSHGV